MKAVDRRGNSRSPETVAFLREVADLFIKRGYGIDIAEVMGYLEVWKFDGADLSIILDAQEVVYVEEK